MNELAAGTANVMHSARFSTASSCCDLLGQARVHSLHGNRALPDLSNKKIISSSVWGRLEIDPAQNEYCVVFLLCGSVSNAFVVNVIRNYYPLLLGARYCQTVAEFRVLRPVRTTRSHYPVDWTDWRPTTSLGRKSHMWSTIYLYLRNEAIWDYLDGPIIIARSVD